MGGRKKQMVEIVEIRISKVGDGYEYEHLQGNGVAVATLEITAVEAIRSAVRQIADWEEEKEEEKDGKVGE